MDCGASINANSKFCQKCGASVDLERVVGNEPLAKDISAPVTSQTADTTDSWPFGKILKYVLLPKPKGSPKAGGIEIALRVGMGIFFGALALLFHFLTKSLPNCVQPETTQLVGKIVNNMPLVKAINVQYVSLKNINELGYNSESDIRSCAATLVTTAGEDNLQYSVKWQNKIMGNFYVEAQILN